MIAPPRPARPAPRHAATRPAASPSAGNGRWIIVPQGSERARRRESFRRAQIRRRRWFGALLLVAVGSAAAAFVYGETWLEIHLLADGMLVFYAAFLFETKQRRAERSVKVRRIGARDERPVPERVRAGGSL